MNTEDNIQAADNVIVIKIVSLYMIWHLVFNFHIWSQIDAIIRKTGILKIMISVFNQNMTEQVCCRVCDVCVPNLRWF